ncbi:unnamed protein product [Rotaria socialis]|uniref:RING-type domain-containing protein n=1 Tax=Rotaria socialis TaxID=392032 RepID=A0A821B925_9BILA|nr:unnamed protein product [Rotaria socialis]CAF4585157.1 unnamed protein product [Rotaria socialis]
MHLEKTTSTTGETPIEARDLMCPICMTIAEDPYITSCCHRVFCSNDANSSQYENGCPLCRDEHFSFQQSAKHKSKLEELTMKCSCSERVLPQEYDQHLERCLNITFTCPHKTCQEKSDTKKYNAQELINHLARAHCDEVPVLGSTYVNKKSLEQHKKASAKYNDLVATLYAELYPKMIDMQLKSSPNIKETSTIFKCPSGHSLIDANRAKRKRSDGSLYSSSGFSCDICHRSFPSGQSWHCSCTRSGFDKCISCIAFQLYDIDSDVLQLAGQDNEELRSYRQQASHDTVHLPRGLFRLLTGSMDDDDDDDDDDESDDIVLRHGPSFLHHPSTFEEINDDDIEANLRED